EYDNVMNSQREVIYELRNAALKTTNVRDRLFEMVDTVLESMIPEYTDQSGKPIDWDMEGLLVKYTSIFFSRFTLTDDQELTLTQEGLFNHLAESVKKSYLQKAALIDPESLAWNERIILLTSIDNLWREHLYEMDQLKEGIGLRGYGQRDPLIEYKREGYLVFDATLNTISSTTLKTLFGAISKVQFEHEERMAQSRIAAMSPISVITARHDSAASYGAQTVESGPGGQSAVKQKTVRNTVPKVGRNDPCPCGSGRKYKVCCGK
ncbi:MAG: SEC-C metal-binding domain-containing protein, partial [Candidatus Latescibacterota bacterium]